VGQRPSAIVVGAGISGLTAAFRLQQAGFRVQVLEADEEIIGGKMSSVEVGGFTMNRGANILPFSYKTIRGLAADVGLGDQVPRMHGEIGTFRGGRIYRLRSDRLPIDGLRTRLLSRKSKALLLRVGVDALRMRKSLSYENLGLAAPFDTESAAEYCDRRLNAELRDYLVEPVVRALFAGRAEDISVVDFFFAVLNFVGSGFMRYPGGIGFLGEALAARLDVTMGAEATNVEGDDGGVTVTWEHDHQTRSERVDACVLAVPGALVPKLYPGIDPRQGEILSTLYTYGTTFNAHLGLSTRPKETALIVQVPLTEDEGLCVVTFDHNSSPDIVPPGKGKLSTYWLHDWCEKRVGWSDDELLDEMLPSIEKIVPGVSDWVEVTRIDRWRPAILKSYPGMYRYMAEFASRIDAESRIQLAGDYLTASSTNGCAVSGELAAGRLERQFFG
jgi:oxygen-dependent protoporphyrinogen oxidase